MKHVSVLIPTEQITTSTVSCILGSFQIFQEANQFMVRSGAAPVMEIALVGASKSIPLNSGVFSVNAQWEIDEIKQTDLVIIPASAVKNYATATRSNKQLIDWIEEQYKHGAEVASMCIGGFMLASTGLLKGKSCSTHWSSSDSFREHHPEVVLQTDKLITDENGIYTNGGAYSFLNLLIYLVEKFYNRAAAIHCAKYFQIEMDRTTQAEFSIFNGHKKHHDLEIIAAQKQIEENYHKKLSIEQISSELHIGRRNFDRRFIKATGITPLEYFQRVRTEAAKKLFETTRKTVSEIMVDVGYSDAKAFREVFSRITGLSPIEYKSKYNKERSWS